jgi:hypothetical protein
MQTTMLMLLALITSQLSDLDDRYPGQTPPAATADAADSSTADDKPATEDPPAAAPITEPAATSDSATGQQTTTGPATTSNPTAPNSSFFDEIDAAAEPLGNSTSSTPLNSTPLNSTPLGSTPLSSTPGETSIAPPSSLGTQPNLNTQPSTTVAPTSPEMETNPTKVLAAMLEAPLEGALAGTKLTLAQAVDNSLSRADQTQRVVAYWDLSQAVAEYYLALDDRMKLSALRQGITLPSPDWETARMNADARLELARAAVHAAQAYLGAVTGNTMPGFAPLPADLPFTGPYETRYAQLFQSRSSDLAEQLNELLPRLYSDLSTSTADIADARKWIFLASDRRTPQNDGNELLKAYELFSARRRQFLDAVMEYNQGIVHYTEIATPGNVDTERLVAMLIRTGSSPSATFDRDIRRAGAEEGASLNDSSSTDSPTGWGSATQSSTERSILVPKS